jgi:flagellar hook-associated protein 3 FlgL
MSSLSVGDMAQTFTLTRSGSALKTAIQRLSNELVSGLAEDTAGHLSGDLGPLAGIQTSLAQLRGYKAVTTETGLFTDAMQAALGRITDMSADLGQAVLAGASPGASARIAALGVDAAQKFEASVAALNIRVGDRSLFAGDATTTMPLPTGADLLDTLETVVAGAVSASDVQTALDDWFASPTGYAAAYSGGDALVGVAVAPGEIARFDINALDPAIRDTLKGLAMTALIDRNVLANNPQERADLIRRSGESLLATQSDLGALAGRLGTAQAQIDQAAQRNTAETTALNIALSDLLSIDSFEVASRLQQTQTQLETLYALTSRMSRLNLVNFL